MTLKEARLILNMSQKEAAIFLGISERTYQEYETNINKQNTNKYKIYLDKLLNPNSNRSSFSRTYRMRVKVGDELRELCKGILPYKKRDCYETIINYLESDIFGKVLILYGLRRTGKTTLLQQAINDVGYHNAAYIKASTHDDMGMLVDDVETLSKKGYKYIFIDEITLLSDFIDTAATLSDIYAMMGIKIVLSGTDSLGFAFTRRDELYDRSIFVHTSYIPFKEYARLLDINDVDKYIEYGGTLSKENISFNDINQHNDDLSFYNEETTRHYIDTAISRNIQRSLANARSGEHFHLLKELYDKGELTNAINREIESMNHQFLLQTVIDTFKSSDLGIAKKSLIHDEDATRRTALYNIDKEEVTKRLKSLIDIKEKEESLIEINEGHISQIIKYLEELDLLKNIPTRYDDGKYEDNYIFVQPGMRYSIAKALVHSLLQDSYFNNLSEVDRQYIIDSILNNVKGRMLEDIVLLDMYNMRHKEEEVFKYKFVLGGEFDVVSLDTRDYTVKLYEIKHRGIVVADQYKYLLNDELVKVIAHRFGHIKEKIVLYRGENKLLDNGIHYQNIEEFLTNKK